MSLLDRIRQESSSPTVKVERQDALLQSIQRGQVVLDARSSKLEDGIPSQSTLDAGDPLLDRLRAELSTYPAIANKKTTLRLEEQSLKDIQSLCVIYDITPETLLEAFIKVCSSQETLMHQVVKEAQSRIQSRVEAGNLRSLITKTENRPNKK